MKKSILLRSLNVFLGISLFLTLGCAGKPQLVSDQNDSRTSFTEESDSREITGQAAQQAKAYNFVEIQFKPGSTVLTDNAKNSVNALMDQAKKEGKIDEVIVLSWADEDFPSQNLKKLSNKQRELAEKRNKVLTDFIKSGRSVSVDSHNMAERPNAISKWFNTEDNKLKKSFLEAGLPTTADSPMYPSKASHSVILIKVE
jgi:hypothetical protein